jgi:hypothetical protein
MEQVLLHLWGDYIVQSHWMAVNKKEKGWMGDLACFLHCLTYTLPFILISQNIVVLFLICYSHYYIDRFNLVQWFMKTKWKGDFGFGIFAPWSTILIDNILHLTCNFLIFKYIA